MAPTMKRPPLTLRWPYWGSPHQIREPGGGEPSPKDDRCSDSSCEAASASAALVAHPNIEGAAVALGGGCATLLLDVPGCPLFEAEFEAEGVGKLRPRRARVRLRADLAPIDPIIWPASESYACKLRVSVGTCLTSRSSRCGDKVSEALPQAEARSDEDEPL